MSFIQSLRKTFSAVTPHRMVNAPGHHPSSWSEAQRVADRMTAAGLKAEVAEYNYAGLHLMVTALTATVNAPEMLYVVKVPARQLRSSQMSTTSTPDV
jgi:hypothetical protein